MDCLENIIKLSRNQCECFEDEDSPSTINDGQTEVYLDELEGMDLKVVESIADCKTGSLWAIMRRARENAVLAFSSDLMSCLEDNYQPKRPNYKGLLGDTANNQSLALTEDVAGQLLKFHRIVGGKFILNRIGLIMNATASVTINVYDNDQYKETPLGTYVINSSANALAYGALTTPLELPMWSNNVSCLEYYLVYSRSGFQPRNNKKTCVPCSGGVKNVVWTNWVNVYGIKGTGTEYSSYTRGDDFNGMILDGQMTCTANRVICSEEYPLDFSTGKAMQMAFCVRFKAGSLVIDEILSSQQINRFTMLDREALYGKRNYYRAQYEKWIQYLCQNTPVINNDCWICKPNSVMRKGTILA